MAGEDARVRAAAALRRFAHELHHRDAADDLLLRVAAAADAVTEELSAAPERLRDESRMRASMFEQDVADGEQIVHFEECFVSGPWNPMGIGMHVVRDGEDAVGDVTLGWAWEGAPARAHGGIVAAVFDDVLGYLLSFLQQPAYTGELTVRYHAPTPIGEPLRFRARTLSRDGRKIDTEATAHRLVDGVPDGPPVATASARFITIDRYRVPG